MAEPKLVLSIGERDTLATYVGHQLQFFGGAADAIPLLNHAINTALDRFVPISHGVRAFAPGRFDHLHSLQYAAFLYLAGRAAWEQTPQSPLVDQLFALNKMLSGIEVHPATDLPGVFMFSHGIGTVLGNVSYGERLVVFQGVTVGRIGDRRPRIGAGVVLYAGASVTGASMIGDGCVIAGGTRVHNLHVPPRMLVSAAADGVIYEPLTRDYLSLYLTTPAS